MAGSQQRNLKEKPMKTKLSFRPTTLLVVTALLTIHISAHALTLSFTKQVSYPTASYTFSIVVGDVNSDGKSDIVTVNALANSVGILFGSAGGAFKPQVNFPTGLEPVAAAIGDFNSDGNLDLTTAVSRCIELRKVGEEIWRIKINVPDNKKGQKRPLFFKSDNLQKA
jgi:hypothetical protein